MAPPTTAPKRRKGNKNTAERISDGYRNFFEYLNRVKDDSNDGKKTEETNKKDIKANESNMNVPGDHFHIERVINESESTKVLESRGSVKIKGNKNSEGKVKNATENGNKKLSSNEENDKEDNSGGLSNDTKIAACGSGINVGNIVGKKGVKRSMNTENSGQSKKAKKSAQKEQHNFNDKQPEKIVVKDPVQKEAGIEIASAKVAKVSSAKPSSTINKANKKDNTAVHGHTKTIDNANDKSKIVNNVSKKSIANGNTKRNDKVNSVSTSACTIKTGNKKTNLVTKNVAKKPNIEQHEQNKVVSTKVAKKVVSNKVNTKTDNNIGKSSKIVTTNKNAQKKESTADKNVANNKDTHKAESTLDKNVASEKNLSKPKTISKVTNINNTQKKVASTNKTAPAKSPLQNSNKIQTGNPTGKKASTVKPGQIEKENIQIKKISKIPIKKA